MVWCGVVGVVVIVLPLHISDEGGGWVGVQIYFPNGRVDYFRILPDPKRIKDE